jgi:hypothetical protein
MPEVVRSEVSYMLRIEKDLTPQSRMDVGRFTKNVRLRIDSVRGWRIQSVAKSVQDARSPFVA